MFIYLNSFISTYQVSSARLESQSALRMKSSVPQSVFEAKSPDFRPGILTTRPSRQLTLWVYVLIISINHAATMTGYHSVYISYLLHTFLYFALLWMDHYLSFVIVAHVCCEKMRSFSFFTRTWTYTKNVQNILLSHFQNGWWCWSRAFKLQKHKIEQEYMQLKKLWTDLTINSIEE